MAPPLSNNNSINNKKTTTTSISRCDFILSILPPLWVLGLLLAITACVCSALWPPTSTDSNTTAATLSFVNVALALGLLLLVMGFGLINILQLVELSQQLIMASAKCILQLYFVGTFVLQYLLQASQAWMVCLWLVGVGLLASNEALARVAHPYPHLIYHMGMSILSSVAIVLAIVTYLHILGHLTPWLEPKTIIPVSGMLLGNCVSGVSLSASSFLKDVVVQQDAIQVRLARGATWSEALRQIRTSAITAALIPTINTLSMTGVVSLPGMMTGQILAGQSATQAALYQMIILMLIATISSVSNILLMHYMTRTVVDTQHHRLVGSILLYLANNNNNNNNKKSPSRAASRMDSGGGDNNNVDESNNISNKEKLQKFASQAIRFLLGFVGVKLPNQPKPNAASSSMPNATGDDDDEAEEGNILRETKFTLHSLSSSSATTPSSSTASTRTTTTPVLQVSNLQIQRTNLQHLSFSLFPGDRLGITGSSGVGKTQLLRTLAGLEDPQSSATITTIVEDSALSLSPQHCLLLHGQPANQFAWPEWRTQVSWMSQDRPNLDGTPRDFFDQVCQYRYQQQLQQPASSSSSNSIRTITSATTADEETPLQPKSPTSSSSPRTIRSPITIAQEWNVTPSTFDRPWSTLSGGEAQRVSLAIVLALSPQVLLLDEATSQLDDASKKLVEQTLQREEIPIVLVSHSNEQVERFCTHHLILEKV